jgi:hypothetical protein
LAASRNRFCAVRSSGIEPGQHPQPCGIVLLDPPTRVRGYRYEEIEPRITAFTREPAGGLIAAPDYQDRVEEITTALEGMLDEGERWRER